MKHRAQIQLTVLICFLLSNFSVAFGQGTAFTYQGRLNDGAAPANGLYDLQFTVYDSASGGLSVGAPLTNAPTTVSNGLFIVNLDFGGSVFTGPARYLEIGVRTNGSTGAYQTLNPRQAFTAAPYAVTAGNVTGVIPSASLSGTYPGAVSFNNVANAFVGNGSGLTSLNAGQLNGTVPAAALGNAWQAGGNAGTSPTNNNFVGTTDNQPLELHVNGQRALRLEPNTNGAANIIGGWSNNFVYAGASQGVIAGGGGQSAVSASVFTNTVSDSYGTVGGGLGNTAGNANSDPTDARGATVGGGANNQAAGLYSTIAGGQNNSAQNSYVFIGGGISNTNAEYASVIGGGQNNTIQPLADRSFIGGGQNNTIFGSTGPAYNAIAGGTGNTIQSNVSYGFVGGGTANSVAATSGSIGGGTQNRLGTNAINGTIGGGQANVVLAPNTTIGGGEFNSTGTNTYFGTVSGGGYSGIGNNSSSATISGGYANTITNNSLDSAIGGGSFNQIGDTSSYSTIAGGRYNAIADIATAATVGGGFYNSIGTGAAYAAIPGGYFNYAGGSSSLAAGNEAQAAHNGTFVWADPEAAPFTSTDTNQFLIRASGGVGINTNAPSGAALNVAGTVRAMAFQGDGSGLTNISATAAPLNNYVFAYNNSIQGVTTGNTFQDLGFGNDAQLNGWAHTAGTSQYTNAQTGLYLIQYSGVFSSNAANGTNAQMRVLLNGAEIPGSRLAVTLTAGVQIAPISRSLLTPVSALDVLTVQFTGSGTGVRLSGTANSTLTVTRIQ